MILLNYGYSDKLLRAWCAVSLNNHNSQEELRRTYVEQDTISARRTELSKQLRELNHGTPPPGADLELQRSVLESEFDQWTEFCGVGKLTNGEEVHRDRVPGEDIAIPLVVPPIYRPTYPQINLQT